MTLISLSRYGPFFKRDSVEASAPLANTVHPQDRFIHEEEEAIQKAREISKEVRVNLIA